MPGALAYFNGQFLDAGALSISVRDAGFLWGTTVTDRARTYQGQFFRLPEHLSRFRRSCELCRVPLALSDAELTDIAAKLVAHNLPLHGGDLVLVMFATPGETFGEDHGDKPRGSLCLHTVSLDSERHRPWLERGAQLVVPAVRQLPAECVPRQAKTRSRMHWWIAEQQARDIDPSASALLLDLSGYVTETSMANFLIVRDGSVISPPRSAILDGVSLRFVEELCRGLDIPFVEKPLSLDDCRAADEALLTSTPFGVSGVSRINGRAIPWPGPILGRLHAAWSAAVGVDIWKGLAAGR